MICRFGKIWCEGVERSTWRIKLYYRRCTGGVWNQNIV